MISWLSLVNAIIIIRNYQNYLINLVINKFLMRVFNVDSSIHLQIVQF